MVIDKKGIASIEALSPLRVNVTYLNQDFNCQSHLALAHHNYAHSLFEFSLSNIFI